MATWTDAEDVPAPAARAFEVLADVEGWPRWTTSMRSVRLTTPGPLRPGSSARVRQPWLPPLTWTVDELVPGERFSWTAHSPGVASRALHRVHPTAGGCRVELTVEQTGPLAAVTALLYGRLTASFLRREVEGLRREVR